MTAGITAKNQTLLPSSKWRQLVVAVSIALTVWSLDFYGALPALDNMGYDAYEYVDRLPSEAIAELHLGGFTPEEDAATPGEEIWVDTHECAVAEGAWDLYRYAIHKFGLFPTLIEWDNQIPPLSTLLREAARAEAIMTESSMEVCSADAL